MIDTHTFPLVSILAPSFLIGSSSFLQVTRTTIVSQMSLKFGRNQSWSAELAALDQFKKSFIREYSKYLMTCCQVSDRCPLGYLFYFHNNFHSLYTRHCNFVVVTSLHDQLHIVDLATFMHKYLLGA